MPRRVYDEQYDNAKELKKGHTYISLKKRLKLIQLVFQQKLTIYKAAKRLKICQPTAKFIIKSYKNGRIYELDPPNRHLHQDSPEKLAPDLNLPPFQTREEIPSPIPAVQPQQVVKSQEGTIGATAVWVSLNNQLFLLPFYYYL